MKQAIKMYIFPILQGLVILYYITNLNLPYELPMQQAILVIIKGASLLLLLRLLCIIISSYIINITKLVIYRKYQKRIITICLFPLFFDINEGKWRLVGLFQAYDDRTCFSMNNDLASLEGYNNLKLFIRCKNRILLISYICTSFIVICILAMNEFYIIVWVFFWGFIEHFFYQSFYKKRYDSNAMSFAGIKIVSTRLVLHILFNQSKLERLDISKDVCKELSKEMYDVDGGYFFDQLCVNAVLQEIVFGAENNFIEYITDKLSSIYNFDENIENMYKNTYENKIRDTIPNRILVFYDHYREYMLYILMYYSVKDENRNYKQLSNYIDYMLKDVEHQCIDDTYLSKKILKNNFFSFKDLYFSVIEKRFENEKSIFTGYDSLYYNKNLREEFVRLFKGIKGEIIIVSQDV